jgi:hypothetical protein
VGEVAFALAVFFAACAVLAALSILFWLAFIVSVEALLDWMERRGWIGFGVEDWRA